MKYAALGVLFVNVSIGGTLTSYAAPPVLMVAGTWNWSSGFMFATFGWKAALATVLNATVVCLLLRRHVTTVVGGSRDIVSSLQPLALFFGALALTAITDNAALTYLGSLIEGISDQSKYMLVAGALAGGGFTVIANAPNPAGVALLANGFNDESIGALGLAAGALAPTAVAAAALLLL